MHVNYDGSDQEDADIQLNKLCHEECGGLCRAVSTTQSAIKYVRLFNRMIADHDLKVGDLVIFTSSADSTIALLGVRLQRPTIHTLVKMHFNPGDDEELLFIDKTKTYPVQLLTSHQLFHLMAPADGEVLQVEVWSYTLGCNTEDNRDTNCNVQLHMANKIKEFTLDPAMRTSTRNPRIKLPFGLKMPKKPRKQKVSKPPKKPRETKSKQTLGQRNDQDSDQGHSHDDEDSAPSSCSEGEVVENQVEDVDLAGFGSALAEEKEATKLIDQQEFFHNELGSNLSSSSTASAVPVPAGAVPVPASAGPVPTSAVGQVRTTPRESSFFSKTIGLADAGIAISNRSNCYYCKGKIQQGAIRFSWHHSTKRPSVWVHNECLRGLTDQENLHSQCKQRLQELRRNMDGSQPTVLAAIDDALTWA